MIVGFAALCLTLTVFFSWSVFYPYYKMREENYRKEMRVLQDLCDSGVVPPDFQINSVTFGGKATNCSQAIVFTQIPIVFGAVMDLWDDSLVKFVIYGGNWKIQCLFAVVFLFLGYHISRTLVTLLCSNQIIDQLSNPARLFLPPTPSHPQHQRLLMTKPPPVPLIEDTMQVAKVH